VVNGARFLIVSPLTANARKNPRSGMGPRVKTRRKNETRSYFDCLGKRQWKIYGKGGLRPNIRDKANMDPNEKLGIERKWAICK